MIISREFAFIKAISEALPSGSARVELGIGDDAAVVVPPRGRCLATVDCLVEGIHFDFAFMTPKELGRKALAVSLSDIAAMAGKPLHALVSLGLRDGLDEVFLKDLYEGIGDLATEVGVDIIGGNLSRSPERFFIDVTVLGETDGTLLTRSGAKVGDWLAVTGPLGSAAAGLFCLKHWGRSAAKKYPALVQAQIAPKPRLELARRLAEAKILTAAIDVSDGLSSELYHLGERSHVGFIVEAKSIPLHEEVKALAQDQNSLDVDWALHGGEDYELLVTGKPDQLSRANELLGPMGSTLFVIGEVTPDSEGVRLRGLKGDLTKLEPRGWSHF